jgi:hypothetical protein
VIGSLIQKIQKTRFDRIFWYQEIKKTKIDSFFNLKKNQKIKTKGYLIFRSLKNWTSGSLKSKPPPKIGI